jgi:hypothetical protein
MLTYSQVTLQDLKQMGISVAGGRFLPEITAIPTPEWLIKVLSLGQGVNRYRSEKAISEEVISPLLLAVKEKNLDKIALFSGVPLSTGELYGICDYIITGNPDDYLPESPLIILIEAKRQDLDTGIPQCAAEMITAKKINDEANKVYDTVFGCVTTGDTWIFLKLVENTKVIIDPQRLYLTQIEQILGIFQYMIDYLMSDENKSNQR